MKTLTATEFKAKCLRLLDEVAETGEPLIILKRGRPVAHVVPPVPAAEGYPQESLRGTVTILGDLTEPVVPPEAWEAENGRKP